MKDFGDVAYQVGHRAVSRTFIDRGPLLTWAACTVCIVVYLGLIREPNSSWETLAQYGYLSPWRIWEGHYWGLITSTVVHRNFLHVAFNVYWLWVLGGILELAVGPIRWLGFCLAAALVSSGVQLAASGFTGYGASGLVYAIFGFIWVGREHFPAFRRVVTPQLLTLFLGWLVLCLIATFFHIVNIGNGAHIGGLAFGAGMAALFVRRWHVRLVSAGLALLVVSALIPLFWCPWSPEWLGHQGYVAHMRHDYANAVRYFERSIQRGGDPVWALRNITIAYAALHDQTNYTETLARLRGLDTDAAKAFPADLGLPNR